MNESDLREKIKAALDKDRGCLCGWRESCDVCSHDSAYNRLRRDILEAMGLWRAPTLEDYGRSIRFNFAEDGTVVVEGVDE